MRLMLLLSMSANIVPFASWRIEMPLPLLVAPLPVMVLFVTRACVVWVSSLFRMSPENFVPRIWLLSTV